MSYLLKEDTTRFILENGTGFLLMEETAAGGPIASYPPQSWIPKPIAVSPDSTSAVFPPSPSLVI